jgi:hypothetical protein
VSVISLPLLVRPDRTISLSLTGGKAAVLEIPNFRIGYPVIMSPLFLVNWHSVSVRFRALMWALVAVLAVVVLLQTAHKPKPAGRLAAATLVGGLRGRP